MLFAVVACFCRKTRSDVVPEATKQAIADFFRDNTVVFTKKDAVIGKRRRGVEPHAVHLQQLTDTEMYRKFLEENPAISIGQRTFMRYKPHYVKALNPAVHRQTCLCQEHTDMELRFDSVAQYRAKEVRCACLLMVLQYGLLGSVCMFSGRAPEGRGGAAMHIGPSCLFMCPPPSRQDQRVCLLYTRTHCQCDTT